MAQWQTLWRKISPRLDSDFYRRSVELLNREETDSYISEFMRTLYLEKVDTSYLYLKRKISKLPYVVINPFGYATYQRTKNPKYFFQTDIFGSLTQTGGKDFISDLPFEQIVYVITKTPLTDKYRWAYQNRDLCYHDVFKIMQWLAEEPDGYPIEFFYRELFYIRLQKLKFRRQGRDFIVQLMQSDALAPFLKFLFQIGEEGRKISPIWIPNKILRESLQSLNQEIREKGRLSLSLLPPELEKYASHVSADIQHLITPYLITLYLETADEEIKLSRETAHLLLTSKILAICFSVVMANYQADACTVFFSFYLQHVLKRLKINKLFVYHQLFGEDFKSRQTDQDYQRIHHSYSNIERTLYLYEKQYREEIQKKLKE